MGNNDERWRELCAQAAVEQDSGRLMELVEEISRLLSFEEVESDCDGSKCVPGPPGPTS